MNHKALFDLEPKDGATLDEWVEYAKKLKDRIEAIEERYTKAKAEARKAQRDVTDKDDAMIYYKRRITELENTIENLKSNKYYRALKWLWGRFSFLKDRLGKPFLYAAPTSPLGACGYSRL
jgi:hypothetical protein